MHRISPFFYMETKSGPLEKEIKNDCISLDDILQNKGGVHSFWLQKEGRNFGRVESLTNWRETKKMQIKLATTCNKNEQQQDAKNNSEL
jgi:hypothetical protein